MKPLYLSSFLLLLLATLVACSLPQPSVPTVTVAEINADPSASQDQQVIIRGYGIIEAMMPLCPGYVGIDTRRVLVDENHDMLPARLSTNDLFESALQSGTLRPFTGMLHLYTGDQGCPGGIVPVLQPWFDIQAVSDGDS